MNIERAMARLIKQGTQDSNLKKNFLLRKLRKDAKGENWEAGMRQGLDDEWMLRLCMANLIERHYDWEGWGLREPRDLLIPDLAPWWDGKPVQKLLILGEQGLGDEILFASLFNEIDCPDITVECDKRLVSVFSRNFPHIEFIGRKHYNEGFWGTDDSWAQGRSWDAQTLMGDLPTWYRRHINDFPLSSSYLTAEPDSRYLGMTGISWVGRQGLVDLNLEKGLSLQYGVDDHLGLEVPDIDLKHDIDGLFSIVAGLDKVISVPTTIVHIAGALGIPCDVVLPKRGMGHAGFGDGKVNNALNWRFNDRGCDWHPSVKIKGIK